MKLISEQWSDDVNYLVEEDPKTGKKHAYIEGVMLQTEVKNKNGRVYPKEVMQKEVKRYTKEYIDNNRAYGELGHPEGPTINLERTSHLITDLYEDGNNFVGKEKILSTPMGNIVKNLLDDGAKLALSNGKSLLAAGIKKVYGKFKKGDHIKVLDKQNKECARGLSSFSSDEIIKIIGHHSREIEKLLGYVSKSEVIHKDDMVEV